MAEKKSELQKLGDWAMSWYNNRTTRENPRKSLAPGIYERLTGKEYPKDPNPIISQRKAEKPAAPAKPANKDKPLPYGSLPGGDDPNRSAAQPGKGPKGNEVGSDSDPEEPGLQGPGDPKGPPTGPAPRVNSNGLVSYGKDLSSSQYQFTSELYWWL